MSALVLALDPGGTTGFCYGHIDANKLTVAPGESRWSGAELYNTLSLDWSHIVWESFEYRYHSRPGLDPTPVKLIGIIELFQEWYDDSGIGYWPQTAAQGLGHYSDESLKKLGLWHKGKGHSRSATKHLLQWATFGFGATLLHPTGREYSMISVEQFRERYLGDVSSRRGRQHAPCQ